MPFVRIDALGADSDRLDALGRAVHDALVESIGIPPDDRFQVLVGHDGVSSTLRYDNYLGIPRDHGIVYISITMRSGRTPGRNRRSTGASPNSPTPTRAQSRGTCSSP